VPFVLSLACHCCGQSLTVTAVSRVSRSDCYSCCGASLNMTDGKVTPGAVDGLTKVSLRIHSNFRCLEWLCCFATTPQSLHDTLQTQAPSAARILTPRRQHNRIAVLKISQLSTTLQRNRLSSILCPLKKNGPTHMARRSHAFHLPRSCPCPLNHLVSAHNPPKHGAKSADTASNTDTADYSCTASASFHPVQYAPGL